MRLVSLQLLPLSSSDEVLWSCLYKKISLLSQVYVDDVNLDIGSVDDKDDDDGGGSSGDVDGSDDDE